MANNNNTQQNNKLLTLVELLNESQPYIEINRLHDNEVLGLTSDNKLLSKIQGSLIGLAVGDALGASVEFRPYEYMQQNPVSDMQEGGTWGLQAGQWTDDTSMALCLAASLIVKESFDGYDQLVRYKRWFRDGYMSSTGKCFDIGSATRQAIVEFENRQDQYAQKLNKTIPKHSLDKTIAENLSHIDFDVKCGSQTAAGNGPLMRLAPIPLFYFRSETDAIQNAAHSAILTHGDNKASDACRFYAALIHQAINGIPKATLLDAKFCEGRFHPKLHDDVLKIAQGSYKIKNGYQGGIRGKGFVLDTLEAALWAFYNDDDKFEKGVLAAVNLGDDTDTTAAIYGQLAGAYYGYENLPRKWRDLIYAKDFISWVSKWIGYEGEKWSKNEKQQPTEIESSNNSKLTNSSPLSSSSIPNKEKRTLYNGGRSTSIVSSVEYSSILERKAIDPSGRIGSLYDGCHDSIIQLSNIHEIEKTNEVSPLINCIFETGDNIECQNLLRFIGFDDELRLSLASDIVSPSGIASVVEYPYLIDECTRVFYYSYSNRHQSLMENTSTVRQNIHQMARKSAATHIITEMNWGIDVIVILRLSSDQTKIIDNKLNEICQSLKSNRKISNEISLDGIVSTHTYSNIPDLSQQTTLIDVYHEINRIKDNPNCYRPLIYILHPIEHVRSDDKTSSATFIPLKSKIAQNIEQHLLRLSLVTNMWTRFTNDKTYNTLNTFLDDQLNLAQNEVTILTRQYINEKERLKKLIPNIRQSQSSQRKTIEEEMLNEDECTRLRHNIDDFQYSLRNLKKKGDFIILLGERGFDYCDAVKSDVKQGDDEMTIENKLMEKEKKSKLILCSNDTFNDKNQTELEKLCSRMIYERESNSNLTLIYADFSYCSYELNDMKIFPLNGNIKRISRQISTILPETESQDGSSRLFSIDQTIINILLLGKSGVGKSTLINTFKNCFHFENYRHVQSNRSIPNIVISFLHLIKNGFEEHFVRLGEYDSNEDHDHPDQSITQNCRSYIFDIGDGKKLRIIDTPGFCDRHGQIPDELIMQHIFSCITDLTHLNGICLLLEAGDTQLDAYQICLRQLFHFLGDDIDKNILFCFTKSLSHQINISDRNASLKLILSSSFPNNIPLNEQHTFVFDSTFFLQSIVERYYTTNADQNRTCEESWNISKNGWKSLLNYLRNTLDPYILYHGLQKAEYARLDINHMIRPILETIRNIWRNVLLWNKESTNGSIQLCPKSLMHHYAICYSCERRCDQYNTFWIMSDSPHDYWDSCHNCTCNANQHMRIDYRLEYEYMANQTNHQIDQMYHSLKLLFRASVYFTHFLSRVADRRSDNPFLSHINRMIDEERYICENISSNGMNLELHNKLVKFKQDYQRQMNIIQEKHMQIDNVIDDWIEHVKQIPMIKIQMDAVRKMKETPV
jgi:ADP-ribosyl-[dinitrogen reductase] hydrolase